MAAAAHPPETRPRVLQAPLARAAALLPRATVGSEALPAVGRGVGGRSAPRRRGPGGPGGALLPGRRASARVPAPGAPVHGHIGFLAPVTASARGRREATRDARSPRSAPSPAGARSRTGPAGQAGKTPRGSYNAYRLAAAGLCALPPRHTHPCAPTALAS